VLAIANNEGVLGMETAEYVVEMTKCCAGRIQNSTSAESAVLESGKAAVKAVIREFVCSRYYPGIYETAIVRLGMVEVRLMEVNCRHSYRAESCSALPWDRLRPRAIYRVQAFSSCPAKSGVLLSVRNSSFGISCSSSKGLM
jgi:hypothetical protein